MDTPSRRRLLPFRCVVVAGTYTHYTRISHRNITTAGIPVEWGYPPRLSRCFLFASSPLILLSGLFTNQSSSTRRKHFPLSQINPKTRNYGMYAIIASEYIYAQCVFASKSSASFGIMLWTVDQGKKKYFLPQTNKNNRMLRVVQTLCRLPPSPATYFDWSLYYLTRRHLPLLAPSAVVLPSRICTQLCHWQ